MAQKSIDTTSMQSALLDMLKWFHSICIKYNIKYYTIGGSLLGAIRHDGFIPWDDDIDLGIPREDYERLISLSQEINSSQDRYIIETPQDKRADFMYAFIKVYDTRTTLIEQKRTLLKRGIFLDIFPLDGFGNTIEESKSHFTKIEKIFNLYLLCTCGKRNGRSLLKNAAVTLFRLIPSWIISKDKVFSRLDNELKKYSFANSDLVGNVLGGSYYRGIMPRSVFGTPTLHKFEDTEVFCVEHFEEYLTQIYGNWRELPPVEKRISHHTFTELDLNKPYI